MDTRSSRRHFVAGVGSALAVSLAGCLGGNGDGEATQSPTNRTDSGQTPTETAQSSTESEESPTDEQSPVVWRESLGSPTTRPAVDGETAYVGTDDGGVYALATGDGHQGWSLSLDEPIVGHPVVADDVVYVVSGETALSSNHRVHALEAATGQERWRFEPQSWWLDVLGVAHGMVYVGTSDDALAGQGETLYAVGVDDGEERWSGEIGDGGWGLVRDESVYVPSAGRLYAYDAVGGTQRWSVSLPDYSARTIAATAETVCYAGDVDDRRGVLVALDAATGDRSWSVDDWFVTSTTLHDGVLYTGGERLAAFDPDTGDRQWAIDESGFVPRAPVRDGTLFAGGDGIRAYDVADGARQWSWTPEPTVQGAIPAGASASTVFVDTYRDADPRNRYAFAVDATAGEQRWVFDGETDLTDLSHRGSRAVVGGEAGTVYALEGE